MNTIVRCPVTGRACSEGTCRERHWCHRMLDHKTLRTTPAMAARVTERLWEIGDIVNVLEAWEAAK